MASDFDGEVDVPADAIQIIDERVLERKSASPTSIHRSPSFFPTQITYLFLCNVTATHKDSFQDVPALTCQTKVSLFVIHLATFALTL